MVEWGIFLKLSRLAWNDPIVLGDFNKGNLTRELPKYKQFIKCPTREENILDHCYTTVSSAYHAVPRAALGFAYHVMVHLIPAYRQKLKLKLQTCCQDFKAVDQ